MNSLSIATDGYLSANHKTLSIATNGYLDINKLLLSIKSTSGGVSKSKTKNQNINLDKISLLKKLELHSKKLKIEDEEIFNILKMFLQLHKNTN